MNPWTPFTGEYEKRFYDIKLHNDAIFFKCWPNADTFITEHYGNFHASLVKEVRLCPPQRGDLTNADVKAFTEDLYAIRRLYDELQTNHPKVFKAYDNEWQHIINDDIRGIDALVDKAGYELWDDDEADNNA